MTENPPSQQNTIEFGPLDIVLALAQNLKWLIFIPVLAGVLVYGLSKLLPKTYTSFAVVAITSSSDDSMLRSATVLDEVLKKFPGPATTFDQRRFWLTSKIGWTRSKAPPVKTATGDIDPTIMTLSVADDTPQTAQAIAQALISAWLEAIHPAASVLQKLDVRIDAEIEVMDAELKSVESAIREAEKNGNESPDAIASLFALRQNYSLKLSKLQELRAGRSVNASILSSPTLPDSGEPRIGVIGSIVAAISAAILVAALSILNAVFKQAKRNPQIETKISEIRTALGMSPHKA